MTDEQRTYNGVAISQADMERIAATYEAERLRADAAEAQRDAEQQRADRVQDIADAVRRELAATEAQRDRLAAAGQQTIDGIVSEHPQCDITNTARCYCGRVTAPLRAALADVRCDHVERVPGGGDVRCSEPAGHEGEHRGLISDVLAAADVREEG